MTDLHLVSTKGLTPHEIEMGTRLEAERNYNARTGRTTDQKAYEAYLRREEVEALQEAVGVLSQKQTLFSLLAGSSTTRINGEEARRLQQEILARKREQAAIGDWLSAEKAIQERGTIFLPRETAQAISGRRPWGSSLSLA